MLGSWIYTTPIPWLENSLCQQPLLTLGGIRTPVAAKPSVGSLLRSFLPGESALHLTLGALPGGCEVPSRGQGCGQLPWHFVWWVHTDDESRRSFVSPSNLGEIEGEEWAPSQFFKVSFGKVPGKYLVSAVKDIALSWKDSDCGI